MIVYSQFFRKPFFYKRIPFLFTLVFLLISSTTNAPVGFALTIPAVPLICIVFWTLHLGNLFNRLEIFILGILTDIVMGTPLGSYSLLYLFISIVSERINSKFSNINIIYNFIIASLMILCAELLINIFIFIYIKEIPSIKYLLFGYLLTIFLYPSFYTFFNWITKITKFKKYYVTK